MAKRKSAQQRIFNLLKPQVIAPTAWDKVYDWLLGKARIIMVVSEILVAMTFAGKVLVDLDAKFLDDSIASQDFRLTGFAATIEPELRVLQLKAQIYTDLWNRSAKYEGVLAQLHEYVPSVTVGLTLRISGDDVTVTGGQDVNLLSTIESRMKASALFSNVSLINVVSEGAEVDTKRATYILNAKISSEVNRDFIGQEATL